METKTDCLEDIKMNVDPDTTIEELNQVSAKHMQHGHLLTGLPPDLIEDKLMSNMTCGLALVAELNPEMACCTSVTRRKKKIKSRTPGFAKRD